MQQKLKNKPLVSFLCIGPGKSGTTSLFHMLKKHPNVCLADVKEPCFFNDFFGKGINWYHSLFKLKQNQIAGEVSNTYIFSQDAPNRAFRYNKKIKIITILRNPIDRAFSHYLFLRRNGEISCSFEEALKIKPDILERGRYSRHLKHWYKYFPKKQIYVDLFENFKENPYQTFHKICSFLNLPRLTQISLTEQEILQASEARCIFLAKAVKWIANYLRKKGIVKVHQFFKKPLFLNILYKKYNQKNKPRIDEKTRTKLKKVFLYEKQKIKRLTNINFKKQWDF